MRNPVAKNNFNRAVIEPDHKNDYKRNENKMTERLEALEASTPEVRCTCNNRCWCNKLEHRIELMLDDQECLSPTEILEECYEELSDKDIEYLTRLSKYRFIND